MAASQASRRPGFFGPYCTSEILTAELAGTGTAKENILQMAVKAVNDTVGPDGLVPTMLVFGAMPRVNGDSPPSPTTLKRADVVATVMRTLRSLMARRCALGDRNGPVASGTLALLLQSEVKVWREHNGWTGPHKLTSIDMTVQLPGGPAKFRSPVVRPQFKKDDD